MSPVRIAMWSGPRNISTAMMRAFSACSDVHTADEAFVTGTFGGLTPVREVDGYVVPAGTPGPVTQKLRELYEALKDEQVLNGETKAAS